MQYSLSPHVTGVPPAGIFSLPLRDWSPLQSYFDTVPLTSLGVTGVGASYVNATAPDYRSIYGDQTAEFLASVGIVKAAVTLSHSAETELMISTQVRDRASQIDRDTDVAEMLR